MKMYIAELTYPGTWLDYEDHDWAWNIQNLLMSLEQLLSEAAMALNLFEQERQRSHRRPDINQWEADAERKRAITEAIEQQLEIDLFDFLKRDEIFYLAEVEFKREKWRGGQLPEQYERRLIFMHAKTFLYALDSIGKFFNVLCKSKNIPQDCCKAKDIFESAFPDLREVRNSTAHREDRSRGLGRKGQPLNPKPVSNRLIHAPGGGALIIDSLNDNRFGSTLANGNYGEIEVSIESLLTARNCIQTVINSFRWTGPKSHYPQ